MRLLLVLGVAWAALGLLLLPSSAGWGYDLAAYRDAAVRLLEHGTLYQPETVGGAFTPGPYGLFMYSPPAGVAMLPTALVSEDVAKMGWHLFHLASLALACALLPVARDIRLGVLGAALLSQSVTVDGNLGNVSTNLLLPLVIGWRYLDKPAGSIATAIAITVRPAFAVIVAWQALRGRWKAVAWTVAAGLVLAATALPFVGVQGYLDYIAVLRNLSAADAIGNHALTGWALPAGMAVAAVAVVLSRDKDTGYVVAACASLLLSPLLWGHYLAVLVLPAALLAGRYRWAVLLPLLTWAPQELMPFFALAVLATFQLVPDHDLQGVRGLRPGVRAA